MRLWRTIILFFLLKNKNGQAFDRYYRYILKKICVIRSSISLELAKIRDPAFFGAGIRGSFICEAKFLFRNFNSTRSGDLQVATSGSLKAAATSLRRRR